MSRFTFGLLCVVFVAGGLALSAWQATEVLEQHRRITTFVPVEAVVHGVEVRRHESRDSKGRRTVSYSPFVHYSYEARGRTHTHTQVLPMPHNGSSEWAGEIASRFKAGETCQAYYDPAQPENAFLVKEYRFLYYALVLVGLAIACIPFLIWIWSPRTAPVLLAPAADGWREVVVARTMGLKTSTAFLASLVLNGGSAATLGHYVWAAGLADTLPLIASGSACLAAGLIPLWHLIRTSLLGRCIAEARILLHPLPIRVGQPFHIRVEQALKVDANVEEVVLELVCDQTTKRTSGGKTQIATNEAHRARVQALPARLFGPGETLSATCEMRVPDHLDATWQKGFAAYPRNAWRIEVDTKLSGAPDYRGRFPISVDRA